MSKNSDKNEKSKKEKSEKSEKNKEKVEKVESKKDKNDKVDKPEKNDKPSDKGGKKTKPRRKKNTVLTDIETYDPNNLRFEDPSPEEIKSGSKVPITGYRVSIYTLNEDGTEGDLVFPVEGFSFGVQENTSPETGKLSGYSMSICMYDREGATQKQKNIVTKIQDVAKVIKKHIYSIRNEIKKYTIEHENDKELKKIDPLYWKRDEKGNIMTERGPTLYPKLIERKAKTVEDKKTGEKKEVPGSILSVFYNVDEVDENGEYAIIQLEDLIGKYYNAQPCAIKFESIWVGGTSISLQYKVVECDVHFIEYNSNNRLLHSKGKPEKMDKNNDKVNKLKGDKGEKGEEKKGDKGEKKEGKDNKENEDELTLDNLQLED